MKPYVVQLHGIEHTVLLNDDDAKKLRATPVVEKAAEPMSGKAAAPLNKSRDVRSAGSRMHPKG